MTEKEIYIGSRRTRSNLFIILCFISSVLFFLSVGIDNSIPAIIAVFTTVLALLIAILNLADSLDRLMERKQ